MKPKTTCCNVERDIRKASHPRFRSMAWWGVTSNLPLAARRISAIFRALSGEHRATVGVGAPFALVPTR